MIKKTDWEKELYKSAVFEDGGRVITWKFTQNPILLEKACNDLCVGFSVPVPVNQGCVLGIGEDSQVVAHVLARQFGLRSGYAKIVFGQQETFSVYKSIPLLSEPVLLAGVYENSLENLSKLIALIESYNVQVLSQVLLLINAMGAAQCAKKEIRSLVAL